MSEPTSYDSAILSRRLTPHRSLDQSAFRLLIAIFCACGVISSLPFIILGAWPVAGFMGLDVLLLYAAFRLNFFHARAYEDILVTPLELRVEKVSPRGAARRWRFNPLFTRLESKEMEEYGIIRLDVVSRERRVEVGACLGSAARTDFAGELQRALHVARRGPTFER